jgi:Ran GTPase-activating protein (RanGAP) involved in mRNA processing and transport
MKSVNRDKNSHNIINNSLDIQTQSHLFELYTESDWENKYNEIVSHYEDKSVDAALPPITVLENIASTLSISQNKLSNEDTIAIAYALRKNIALESLTLSYNKIDKVGANALAAALTINCTLTYLGLDFNNISNEGAKSIGQMLRINNSIATLSLDYNCIGDKGANAIAIGLKNNKALASLKLSNNQITEFGAASLLIIIYKINSCLGSLDLKGNSINGEMKSLLISSKCLFCILKI